MVSPKQVLILVEIFTLQNESILSRAEKNTIENCNLKKMDISYIKDKIPTAYWSQNESICILKISSKYDFQTTVHCSRIIKKLQPFHFDVHSDAYDTLASYVVIMKDIFLYNSLLTMKTQRKPLECLLVEREFFRLCIQKKVTKYVP